MFSDTCTECGVNVTLLISKKTATILIVKEKLKHIYMVHDVIRLIYCERSRMSEGMHKVKARTQARHEKHNFLFV